MNILITSHLFIIYDAAWGAHKGGWLLEVVDTFLYVGRIGVEVATSIQPRRQLFL